jgi:hypothetical protein
MSSHKENKRYDNVIVFIIPFHHTICLCLKGYSRMRAVQKAKKAAEAIKTNTVFFAARAKLQTEKKAAAATSDLATSDEPVLDVDQTQSGVTVTVTEVPDKFMDAATTVAAVAVAAADKFMDENIAKLQALSNLRSEFERLQKKVRALMHEKSTRDALACCAMLTAMKGRVDGINTIVLECLGGGASGYISAIQSVLDKVNRDKSEMDNSHSDFFLDNVNPMTNPDGCSSNINSNTKSQ